MWPDGLAVWFFLRIIFKYGYKIWERSWVQFPVRPFFLSPRSVIHVPKPAGTQVVYDRCSGGAVSTIFGNITRYSHMYQHQSTQLKRSRRRSIFITNTVHSLQSQSHLHTLPVSPSPTWTTRIALISLPVHLVVEWTSNRSLSVLIIPVGGNYYKQCSTFEGQRQVWLNAK